MSRIAVVVTKRSLDETDTSWEDHWRTCPADERLAMTTELSPECVGADPDTRLQRGINDVDDLATARPQDLVDVEALRRGRAGGDQL